VGLREEGERLISREQDEELNKKGGEPDTTLGDPAREKRRPGGRQTREKKRRGGKKKGKTEASQRLSSKGERSLRRGKKMCKSVVGRSTRKSGSGTPCCEIKRGKDTGERGGEETAIKTVSASIKRIAAASG